MANGVNFSPEAPASPAGSTVTAGDFWPEIDVNHFRDALRIGGTTIGHPRLVEALRSAMFAVEDQLIQWQAAQIAAAYATLAAVPSTVITEAAGEVPAETKLTMTWRRAVYHTAAADLCETNRDLTASQTGAARADEQAPTATDYRRNATHAIRDILKTTRTKVSLI